MRRPGRSPTPDFNPPTPWGVGRVGHCRLFNGELISIHPPRGGWDRRMPAQAPCEVHFNPPTPWGVGPTGSGILGLLGTFQSTHPVGGGTVVLAHGVVEIFISIHPPRGGWDAHIGRSGRGPDISIHPPRGGWDRWSLPPFQRGADFNPPTPWGVGQVYRSSFPACFQFQSTHPVGGGTSAAWMGTFQPLFQSTHPVGGGTAPSVGKPTAEGISIHPPRGGWDSRSTRGTPG